MQALVIDDSRVVRTIVGSILRELGYEVTEAANGREGLERLRANPAAQLVLVDWNMPEMSGIELIREVRKESRFDHVSLVMVTAETERGQIQEALLAGANEYVMKPFTKDAIAEKLQAMQVASRS
jgi:two-component system chemotaxis response regulator CheY